MTQGWVKLWRALRDQEWYADGDMVRVFLELLLSASHIETQFCDGKRMINLLPGEVATTSRILGKRLKIPDRKVRRILNKLHRCRVIDRDMSQKVTERVVVYSLVNWEHYNGSQEELDRDMSQKMTMICPESNKDLRREEERNKKKKAPPVFTYKWGSLTEGQLAKIRETYETEVVLSKPLDAYLRQCVDGWLAKRGKGPTRRGQTAAFQNWLRTANDIESRYAPRGEQNEEGGISRAWEQKFLQGEGA